MRGRFRYGLRSLACIVAASLSLLVAPGCTWQQVRNDFEDYHVHRGEAAAARNDLDAALREFSAAVRLNPKSGAAYSHIADVHRKRGDVASAVVYFSEAVRVDPFDFGSALS